MVDKTDEDIARQVQRGDVEAFGVLVDRYKEKMTRYARKFLFRGDDIEDVVQETLIKAYVNIQSFDASRRFSPWLYRIAHNEFINAVKKRGREKLSFLDLDTLFPHPVSAETADRGLHAKDLKTMLDAGLDTLTSKYREPLILYYFEELDYREIADILQIPVSTVGVRLRRGKERLQKIMKQTGHAL